MDEEERARVSAAVGRLAKKGDPFTTDQVWRRVRGIPITKGIGSLLSSLRRRGVIRKTRRAVVCSRGGKHDHAQRLTIWLGERGDARRRHGSRSRSR